MKDFAVLIVTHGRAHNLLTWDALRQSGYTGDIYLVIDDEDEQADDYFVKYGSKNVIQFCKKEAYKTTDSMDATHSLKSAVFARNECYRIAKELGLKYFLMLDDDYPGFRFRYREGDQLKSLTIKDMDKVCKLCCEFLKNTPASMLCMSQGGDFIGGVFNVRFTQQLIRKAMNSYFCVTDRPVKFSGMINEDVNTYTTLGSRGVLFFTYVNIMAMTLMTQVLDGGMTGVYQDNGTYQKSFYSVMGMPSSVTIRGMGTAHRRIHHHINWVNTVPMILNEKWKLVN